MTIHDVPTVSYHHNAVRFDRWRRNGARTTLPSLRGWGLALTPGRLGVTDNDFRKWGRHTVSVFFHVSRNARYILLHRNPGSNPADRKPHTLVNKRLLLVALYWLLFSFEREKSAWGKREEKTCNYRDTKLRWWVKNILSCQLLFSF